MITTLLEFFAFGAVGFWIALSTFLFVLIAISDEEYYTAKLLLTIGVILLFFPQLKVLSFGQIIVVAIVYFIIGIFYSALKWWAYIKNIFEKNKSILRKYNIDNLQALENLSSEPRTERDEKNSYDYSRIRDIYISVNVNNYNTKQIIINWIMYWPWSVLKLVTFNLAEFLFDLVHSQYDNMINSALKKFKF